MKIHTVPYIYVCIYIYETYKSVSYISYIHTKSAKNDRTVTLCLIHSVCPGKFRLQSVVTGVFRGFWSSSWNCRKEMEVMICSQPWTEGSSIAMALNLGKLLYVRSNCSAWNERWPSIYWDASPFSSYINVYIYHYISHYITIYQPWFMGRLVAASEFPVTSHNLHAQLAGQVVQTCDAKCQHC